MSDPANNGGQLPPSSGFENESDVPAEAAVPAQAAPKKAKQGKTFDELKANFSSVFGHGIGKMSLIFVVLFVIVAIAFAVRGFSQAGKTEPGKATNVDVPSAPKPGVTVDAVDAKEAQRRAQQAALEADSARAQGQSYQPDFTPNIKDAPPQNQGANGAQPMPQGAQGGPQSGTPPLPSGAAPVPAGTQPVNVTVATGQPATTADDQKRQAELDKQRAARDAYVSDLRKGVRDQVEELLGKDSSIRGKGSYSVSSYAPAPKTAAAATTSGNAALATVSAAPGAATTGAAQTQKKVIFKAGKVEFAETDAEINTDDGGDVFATMRGGPYSGAKLIGKIEQAPRNIRLRFTVLSPQDDRPTLAINAIAIREEDAKQGVADEIDNHTLARYTALFAASALSGLAKAVAQPQGTVVILPNGQTVTQSEELTNRRIAMYALGEVGVNAAAEVKKFVDQPPTYKTNAKRGIGIIFLNDVTAQQ